MPVREKAVEAKQAPPRPEPPKPFVGQRHIVEYFERIAPEGLAQAYLFHGPRGVGKKTFARALVRSLHCLNRPSFPLGYCGRCGPCIRSLAGTSGDTILVDSEFVRRADEAAHNVRVGDEVSMDATRALLKQMQLKSYEGGRLVSILPDFDSVTGEFVYNALLKELEEPQAGQLFIVTVERPESVLATIRSRTIELRFAPLSATDIAEHLIRHYRVPKAKAEALARRAQGSLGDALDELDEDVATFRESAREWALACLRSPKSLPPMPQLTKEDRAQARADLEEVIRQARLIVRDIVACAVGARQTLLDQSHAADTKKTAEALGDRAVTVGTEAMKALDEASRIANTNVQPPQVLGWLQIRLRSLAMS